VQDSVDRLPRPVNQFGGPLAQRELADHVRGRGKLLHGADSDVIGPVGGTHRRSSGFGSSDPGGTGNKKPPGLAALAVRSGIRFV
jgi:hypothetical protein